MREMIRLFLMFEAASFALAALVHSGLLLDGYQHPQAAIGESLIEVVLLVSFGLTWIWPARTRLIGIAAQAFALLGTLVGVFTLAIGLGPRTGPDIASYLAIVAALVGGLILAARAPADAARRPV